MFDGLGHHCTYRVVKHFDEVLNSDIGLRAPHNSRRGQKEDFANYARFRPAHEVAKRKLQVEKVRAYRAECEAKGVPVDASHVQKLATLSQTEVLECAVEPWQEAFADAVNIKGWADEGIVSFTCKVAWDMKAEEESSGRAVQPVRDHVNTFTHYGLQPPRPFAAADFEDSRRVREEESVEEEAARRLTAGELPKKSKVRVTSGDLYKLHGSVSGRVGFKLLREKEVQNEMARQLAETKGKTKEAGRKRKAEQGWQLAANALVAFEESKSAKPPT
eukprot:2316797-Prymnesium_polylepis.1